MRKNFSFAIVFLGAVLFFCTSYYEPLPQYIPVFMMRPDLEQSVSYQDSERVMENPGKIYVRGTEIFVNERYKGVHIIDNSNPYNPVQKGFITVPGCIDMAVKDNIIYMDNAVDLVAFDLESKAVTHRVRNLLPEHMHPNGYSGYFPDRPEGMILVGWRKSNDND